MKLPTPSLMRNPARKDVRTRWIGRKVQYHRKHLTSTPRTKEEQEYHTLWRARGTGVVLDVGAAMWLLIRWSNGDEVQEHKIGHRNYERPEGVTC